MSNFDLDALLAQRAEATGVEEGRIDFDFTARAGDHKGKKLTFSIRDNMSLSEDDWDELSEIREDFGASITDIAVFWMGEDEWERFVEAGGTPKMIVEVVVAKTREEVDTDSEGRPTRRNRSQRRAAGRKR